MSVSIPRKRVHSEPHPPAELRTRMNNYDTDSSGKNIPKFDLGEKFVNSRSTSPMCYSRGALIGLRLIDFQVAVDSTYKFEPYLNMVLGSNGSGKSTIVTAMYLLFKGSIAALHRKSYQDFIRHNCQRAVISAMIQGSPRLGENNPVITMVINKVDGQPRVLPEWYSGDQRINSEELSTLIAGYNIQVNNLCQFLPQHRVSAFSQESREQRLISTEQAVGYDGMVEDHHMLSTVGSKLIDIKNKIEELEKNRDHWQQRKNQLTERVVAMERNVLDRQRVELLNDVTCLMNKKKHDETLEGIKADLEAAKLELHNFDDEHANYRQLILDATAKLDELDAEKETIVEKAKQAQLYLAESIKEHAHNRSKVAGIVRKIEEFSQYSNLGEKIKELDEKLKEAKVAEREAVSELDGHEIKSDEAMEAMENDMTAFRNGITKLSIKIDSIRDQLATLERRKMQTHNSTDMKKRDMAQLEARQTKEREPSDVAKFLQFDTNNNFERCCRYIEHHKNQFEEEIILPAVVSMNIKDPRAVRLISAVLRPQHITKFICQNERDHRKLINMVSREPGIDLSSIYVRGEVERLSDTTMEGFKKLGIQGVLLDFVEGPPALINYMASVSLGRTLYTFERSTPEMRQVLRNQGTPLTLIDKDTHYSMLKSKYGSRQVTESSNPIPQRIDPAVACMKKVDNSDKIRALRLAIANNAASLKSIMEEHDSKLPELERLKKAQIEGNDTLNQGKTVINSYKRFKMNIKSAQTKVGAIQEDINAKQRKLDSLPEVYRDAAEKLSTALDKLKQIKVDEKKFAEAVSVSQNNERIDALIKFHMGFKTKLERSLAVLKQRKVDKVEGIRSHIQQLQDAASDVENKFRAAKRKLQRNGKLQEAEEIASTKQIAEVLDEISRLAAGISLQDTSGDTIENVRHKLADATTHLDRALETLETSRTEDAKLTRKREEVRPKWEGALRDLQRKVSTAFSSMFKAMGLNGKVTLACDDNLVVNTWGLDIEVAFRKDEPLSRLSNQRQSGGERAVSTAVYLLALQGMARAPFRVLDEINQGMDRFNERKVLRFFVDLSCNMKKRDEMYRLCGFEPRSDVQQYFLISPKLIPRVPFHRNMNVTFITGSTTVGDSAAMLRTTAIDEERIKLIKEQNE